MTAERNERVSEFVRGFFLGLKARGIPAAVLHDGRDGFDRGVTDVDFVVGSADFRRLPKLIDQACRDAGWQLCQVLRHETTAAYFVCSAVDDPGCAVALDACSDYQRNGVTFLSAEELLDDLRPLPWGGAQPAETSQLRYRFAKAAAKGKDPEGAVGELLGYSEAARLACADWLRDRWRIEIGEWSPSVVSEALARLRPACRKRPSVFQPGSLQRMLVRMFRPSGMVAATDEATAAWLAEEFGRVHFRSVGHSNSFGVGQLKALIRSTLVLVPRFSGVMAALLPGECRLCLDAGETPESASRKLATALHQRCARREGLSPH